MVRARLGAIITGLAVGMVLLQGCATYSDKVAQMEGLIAGGKPGAALKVLDAQDPSARDEVVYLLNKASLLHQSGEYHASNAALEQVKPLIEKYAVLSVSEQAGALTISDNLRAYAGAAYERVYVHIFAALNYLALEKLHEARVEALQMDNSLNQITKDVPVPAGFARYLSGLIFETLGEWDDAMIAYRKAYEAYKNYPPAYALPLPESLKQALLRVAMRQGLKDEAREYRAAFGLSEDEAIADLAGMGEVVVFLESGLAPLKRDNITGAYAADGRLLTIALPYYQSRQPTVTAASLRADGHVARSELLEDVNRMASAELEREMPGIVARTLARAVVKNKTIKSSQREGNDAVGLLVNMAGIMTERADTRSWSTLPNRIYILRLPLAPGRYHLKLELRDANGVVQGVREYNEVVISAGSKRFISEQWVVPADLQPRGALLRPGTIDQRRRN